MKIRFETLDHKLHIRFTLEAILANKDFKIRESEARIITNIMTRLSSHRLEDEWRRSDVDILASILHQVMQHRENTSVEVMQTMGDEEKQLYAFENNILLLVLDYLSVKLGISKERKISG